ncbi:transcriptional regulator [Vibrio aestuarianus]|uniref:ChrR family anti-sigma-E factor n=1 Tax=Vibrio aestuarianus TaxID=28171 RepID=UPI0015587769|nr:ChrR family anti-sigma-E factor [Vibrio aestuarianus]NGZ12696.1 transcriptional regulator [Vibrio aestuarianus]NKZ48844.1 transcriptional regulator [Vibrio aestuarianus]
MSHHPSNELLKSYANGSIDAAHGLMVSAHIEHCAHCRDLVEQFEAFNAQAAFESNSQPNADNPISVIDFDRMFDNIVCLETISPSAMMKRPPKHVEVNGKRFELPSSLGNLLERMGEWRSYGGKVFSAHLDLGEEARMNFMYINRDVHIPQHTHKGIESTLVLHGGFSDEDGHYDAGAFIQRDASIKHSPYTKASEDCLCLTVLTEPMLFTQGVARVFNLFGKGLYP